MASDHMPRQWQHLAFLCYYNEIHGVPPSGSDIQRDFQVSPPSCPGMRRLTLWTGTGDSAS